MARKRMFAEEAPFECAIAPAEPAPKVLSPEPPVPTSPIVPIDVFCAVSAEKPDQLRGFVVWAKRNGWRTLSIPEWREKLEIFQKHAV